MRRSFWLGTVLLIVIVAAAATARMLDSVPSVDVTTESVSTGPIVRSVIATGTVQALTTVQVGSQVSGTIQSLQANYNSIVRAGQILARLDPSLLEAALTQAQAALGQAQADEAALETTSEQAQSQLERAVELAAQQLIPESDLETARTAADQAIAEVAGGNARVAEAKAALEQVSVDLGHTIIHSPVDGIVLERSVDVGQTIAAGLQSPLLFRIATDLRHLQVEANVDESDIGSVNPGAPASFRVDGYPDEIFSGTVAQVRLEPIKETTGGSSGAAAASSGSPIAPAATSPPSPAGTVVSYATIIDVANPDEKLRPGMTATVVVDALERDRAVRIPNNALVFHPSADVLRATRTPEEPLVGTQASLDKDVREVWKYVGGRFTPIAVHTGLADDAWTELVSGPLTTGDRLVTNASLKADGGH